jgi:hypothetical protein
VRGKGSGPMEAESVLCVFSRFDRKSDTGRQGPRCRCRLSMSVSVHSACYGTSFIPTNSSTHPAVLCRAFIASTIIAPNEGRRMDESVLVQHRKPSSNRAIARIIAVLLRRRDEIVWAWGEIVLIACPPLRPVSAASQWPLTPGSLPVLLPIELPMHSWVPHCHSIGPFCPALGSVRSSAYE